MWRWLASILTVAATSIESAFAAAATETAHWGGFQTANGPVAEFVVGTYNIVFWICLAIYILVQGIIIISIFAFRKRKNRTEKDAAQFSHNTGIEILWTVIPVIICMFIGIKAYQGIMFIKTVPEDAIAVDVIGYQFNWDFDYPDHDISIPFTDANIAPLKEAGINNPVKTMVVPQGKNVVLNITAKDVLHAVYVPALGIKSDAIPGRITYSWFNATETGDYLGQCAELCGPNHGEMYFNVRVLPEAEWEAWVDAERKKKGLEPYYAKIPAPTEVAVEDNSVGVSDVQE